MKPSIPKTMMRTSFIMMRGESPLFQKVTISIMGGKMRARVELLTAPTRDMTSAKLGMAAAKPTTQQRFNVLNLKLLQLESLLYSIFYSSNQVS